MLSPLFGALGPLGARYRGGAASTLLDGLTHSYNLDEVGGARADAVGGAPLTDNNAVGSAAGQNNLAASFVAASSQKISRATPLQAAPKTYVFWVKMGGTAAFQRVLQDRGTFVDVWHDGANNLDVKVQVYDGSGFPTADTGFVVKASGTWLHLVVAVDPVASGVSAYVNNGEFSANAALTAEGSLVPFSIGGSPFVDGLIDALDVYDRILTADERTESYASGAGKFYPFS